MSSLEGRIARLLSGVALRRAAIVSVRELGRFPRLVLRCELPGWSARCGSSRISRFVSAIVSAGSGAVQVETNIAVANGGQVSLVPATAQALR